MAEITPALRFESLLETLFALGGVNGGGRPGRRQLAAVAAAHFDTVRLAFPPAPFQRLVLGLVRTTDKTPGGVTRSPADR